MEAKSRNTIAKVHDLLMQFGIKSLTMDDIARNLGISKKTIYTFVSDKADLVEKAIIYYMDEDKAVMEKIHDDSENAIEELISISKNVSQHLRKMHPSILFDLQKYYPKAYEKFEEYKSEHVMACVKRNLEEGISQGLFRENLNIPIVAKLYVGRIDLIMDPTVFPPSKFDVKDVFYENIRYHIRGIASEKGVKYLKERFKKPDTDNPVY